MHGQIGSIADDSACPEFDERFHLGWIVNGPKVHLDAGRLQVQQEVDGVEPDRTKVARNLQCANLAQHPG